MPAAASTRKRTLAAAAKRPGDDAGSRERIHRTALRLFARYGYEGVSLQRIADEVGLHKSTLFHHYGSKLELVDEVFDAVVGRVLVHVEPLVAEQRPTLATLYAAVDALIDGFSQEPEAARLLVNVMSSPDDSELRTAGSAERSMLFYSTVASWLDHARRAGVIRRVSIRQAIPNLMGLVLFYPAVASDLAVLVGPEPFSGRAREVRKREVRHVLAGMLEP